MSVYELNKQNIGLLIHKYRGWCAFVVGFISGIFIGYLFQSWQLLFLSAFLAGLFATTYKRGILYGSTSILAVYVFFLAKYIVTTPALRVMDIFADILINGILGTTVSGMGFLVILLTLLIGFLIGLTGGYLGSVIHSLISWPKWVGTQE